MYKCYNCNIEWKPAYHNQCEEICHECGLIASYIWEHHECPYCKRGFSMARPKAHILTMICHQCKYEYTDDEAEAVLKIRKVDTVDQAGNPITAFINIGEGHEKYHSWYCLKEFHNYMQLKAHDVMFHKVGDPMAGCVPSGFISDLPVECGD